METTKLGIGIYYDHTRKDDKHFFGGFLNLAINNIESVLRIFSEKFNNNKYVGEKTFADVCLRNDLPDTEFRNRVDFLKFHFPVLGYLQFLSNNDRAIFRENFSLLLNAVEELRNFYTHYYHKPVLLSAEFYHLIDNIFAEVVEDVKRHKMKDDKTRHLLKKSLSKELEIRFQQNLTNLKELKLQGKKVNLNDEAAIRNGVLNDSFNHLVYKKDDKSYPTYSYEAKYNYSEIPENSIALSQSGLVFLLSMFLNKKETEDLKSRVRGFKGKIIKDGEENISGLKFMATHWVFSYLAFKAIKHRLNTDFKEETLLVQIIDELSKVPDEVYKTFDKSTQDMFVEDINEYLKDGNKDLSIEESKVIHPVIRKRYENKFNYFAIRFLDEFVNFKSLRFQIHLGNYVHDRRIKNINGTTFRTERIVKERIKVFGKLSEIDTLKSDFILNKLDKSSETGWEIYPNPSYNFIDNNIPLYISADGIKGELQNIKKERTTQKPDERKRRKEGKINKYEITGAIAKKNQINYDEPVAMLSLNEIPALLYEILVRETKPEDIEKRLVQKLEERLEIIKNYDPANPLAASQISKRLRYNDSRQTIDKDKLLHLINRELVTTDEKLNIIKNNRQELNKKIGAKVIRKYVFTNSELGREAVWLADDIKRFMPENIREDWKGYQHSQLQQSFAFYDMRNNEAFSILNTVWDFDDDKNSWNKWIRLSFSNNSFERFYESYLKGRRSFLSDLSENILQHFGDRKALVKFLKQQMPKDFLEKRHYQYESLQVEKTKILSKPFVFPRGIFDEKPTFIKGKNTSDNIELFAEWYQFSYNPEHQFQKFYCLKREYKEFFKEVLESDDDFNKNSKGLTSIEQFDLFKMKQDLQIKKIKTQDLFLKLIADKLFQKVFNYSIDLSLEDMYLTQEERIEKENAALLQSKKLEGDISPNIINDNFIWNKTIPFEKLQIYESQVKLKNIGKFKNFLRNEKVEKLLSYDENRIWSKVELETEINIGLNSYESIRRDELLREIQVLEKEVLKQYSTDSHPAELEFDNYPQFKLYIVNGILRKKRNYYKNADDIWLENLRENDFENLLITELQEKSDDIQLAFLLILIRNKFAHNQLPAKQFYDFIKENFTDVEGVTFAQLYLNFVRYAKGNLLKNLN